MIGKLYYCDKSNISNLFQKLILTKNDCFDYGGDWVNQDYHYDNVLQSMTSLFIVSSTVDWIALMLTGLDAKGVDEQP